MRQLTTSCTHAHTVTETEIHTERKNNNTHTIHESNKKILKTLLGDDVLLRGPFLFTFSELWIKPILEDQCLFLLLVFVLTGSMALVLVTYYGDVWDDSGTFSISATEETLQRTTCFHLKHSAFPAPILGHTPSTDCIIAPFGFGPGNWQFDFWLKHSSILFLFCVFHLWFMTAGLWFKGSVCFTPDLMT